MKMETKKIVELGYLPVGYSELPTTYIDRTKDRYDRNFDDDLIGPVVKSKICVAWDYGRWVLLAFLVTLPALLYPVDVISKAWPTSLLGLVACCLPSGGAPVAGGIVFIPGLTALGFSPKQCVAFVSASQAIGCGLFTPANWISKDPGIIVKSSLPIALPCSFFGLYLSLFVLPMKESDVSFIFALFCLFLAGSVIHGLQHQLTTQDEKVVFDSPRTWRGLKTILVYGTTSIIGGMLAGWIGIGIEKIYFMVITNYHHAEIRRATVTAIGIIGWLSTISAICHLFVFHDVPIPYWICSLPGILFGSIIGPTINSTLGSRNVMYVFCGFLFLNVFLEFRKYAV